MAGEEKVLIRDFYLYINTGTDAVPVWTQVCGLHPDLEWSDSPTKADTTDQDANGVKTHVVASHDYSASVKGKRLEDPNDGSRDVGQEAVETVANVIGSASVVGFKIATPGAATIVFKASAAVKPFGGGMDDACTWEAQLSVSGQPTWS